MLKTDVVYDLLRRRIRDLEFAPGAPLRKEEIAAELGVSRAPVSEALARLAEEGLVDVFPRHGSFVAQIRAGDVREGLFLRMAIEVQAARHAAVLSRADLAMALDAVIEGQARALDDDDLALFYQLDEKMHEIIMLTVGFPRVERYLDSARAPLDRMRRLVLPQSGRPEATLREHRAIVDAIKSGDPEFAAAAMRAHLTAVAYSVEAQLRAAPKNLVQ